MITIAVLSTTGTTLVECANVIQSEGFRVRSCRQHRTLWRHAKNGACQAAVIDFECDGLDALEICIELRVRHAWLPLIGLGRRRRIANLVEADILQISCGTANDLVQRVRSALQVRWRAETPLNVKVNGRFLVVGDRTARLTVIESCLIEKLRQNANEPTEKAALRSMNGRNLSDRALEIHVSRLRSKLGLAREQLETISGLGYRWSERQDEPPELR